MGAAQDFFSNLEFNRYNLGTEFSMPIYEDLNDILANVELDEKRSGWNTYSFNGMNVPRTTYIIGDTIYKEYITQWAARLGESYNKEMRSILDTGSLAHAMIEDFIINGKIKSDYEYNKADPIQAMRAFQNFKSFWNDMKNKGYTIESVAIEVPFSTPWYGGTIDFIARIIFPNGVSKLFILDFKTSKSISYSYFLQTIMYANAYTFLRNNVSLLDKPFLPIDPGPLNGIGVIRVDKEKDKYEYVLADFMIDIDFIAHLQDAAGAMINWYYNMNNIEIQYKNFRNTYLERGGIYGLYR